MLPSSAIFTADPLPLGIHDTFLRPIFLNVLSENLSKNLQNLYLMFLRTFVRKYLRKFCDYAQRACFHNTPISL
jgi:hypothetical protein